MRFKQVANCTNVFKSPTSSTFAVHIRFSACNKKQHYSSSSGRFVKQEQWERWRAKRKFVSGQVQAPEYHPQKKFEIVCVQNPAI